MVDSSKSIMIIDDSIVDRRLIRDAIGKIPGVEVVGHASNGATALKQIQTLKPDMVVMDYHMPEMNGLQILESLESATEKPAFIMVSATNEPHVASKALNYGAADFIFKPVKQSFEENQLYLIDHLDRSISKVISDMKAKARGNGPLGYLGEADAVLIGVSTGGPETLKQLFFHLPQEYRIPILIAQHLPPDHTFELARELGRITELPVCEAFDGQYLEGGTVYVAPGGMQSSIDLRRRKPHLSVEEAPDDCYYKPSIDHLFDSAARFFGKRCLGVVLTGMGSDGTKGAQVIQEHGGMVIAQTPETCVMPGMPRNVIDSGFCNEVCGLAEITHRMTAVSEWKGKGIKCLH